jgi:hypothetical protein
MLVGPADDVSSRRGTEAAAMYAAIGRYVDNTELADTLAPHEEAIRAAITGIDGFRAYFLVRAHDSTVAISVFDDADGAEESSRVAAAWMRENLANVTVAPPKASVGEVVISALR